MKKQENRRASASRFEAIDSRKPMIFRASLLSGAFAAMFGMGPVAYADPPVDLFTEIQTPAAAPEQLPPKVVQGHSRHVAVRTDILGIDKLNLKFFDDASLLAVRDRIMDKVNGHSAWVGHLEGEPDSEVILTVRGPTMMGTIKRGELGGYKAYEIVSAGNDEHVVREIDLSKTAPHSDPIPVSEADMEAAAARSGISVSSAPTAASGTGTTIDVLVVWSQAAETNAGGAAGIQNKIVNAITAANQAYLNSAVNMQLNLVHMEKIAYTETGDMSQALARLQNTGDGVMDNIQSLRTTYGADQVALVDADANYCGIGYQMTSLSTSFASYAYVVVHDDSVYSCLSNNTMAHEWGHNQGNAHNPENSTYAGIYPYSYGYRICGVWRDVMSYSCSGEPKIPYFSNPNVSYNGSPTGVTNSQDTAKSMNSAATTVASFYPSTTPATTAPRPPSSLSARALSSSSMGLSWVDDTSVQTAGIKVQRSPDNANWTLIATLGCSSGSSCPTGYTDTGLNPSATYYYRVDAYNSIGDSPFSNTASATTLAPDLTAPTVQVTNPTNNATVSGSGVMVSASATDNTAMGNIAILIDGVTVSTAYCSASSSCSSSYKWNTRKISSGSHTITSRATDAAGNTASSAPVQVIK